uniref:Putative secreted protein n=1 Tax=Ixodes ricinus TaxID=34613 RepID=A0A6B0UL43_IXORI
MKARKKMRTRAFCLQTCPVLSCSTMNSSWTVTWISSVLYVRARSLWICSLNRASSTTCTNVLRSSLHWVPSLSSWETWGACSSGSPSLANWPMLVIWPCMTLEICPGRTPMRSR